MTVESRPLDPDLLAILRDVGKERIRDLATQVDRTQEFSRELWELLSEQGLPTMPYVDEDAGHDGSFRAYVEGIEEVASHGACAALYSGPTVQVATAIDRFGTPEQKERWGQGLISGGLLGAWSFTVPQTGSDPQQIQTWARRDGDEWVITGSKMFTSFAPHADVALVFAKTSERRLGAFLVDTTDPGWQPGPPVKMLAFGGLGPRPGIDRRARAGERPAGRRGRRLRHHGRHRVRGEGACERDHDRHRPSRARRGRELRART